MLKNRYIVSLSVILVLFASVVTAYCVTFIPLAKAYTSPGNPTGFVNDFASLINDERQQILERKLQEFKNEKTHEIFVVTVDTIGGDSIENYANELFREWGIGTKEKNNGVLLLISKDDRLTRIEVGNGLEGDITDLEAGRIVDLVIRPAFRENRFEDGIDEATNRLIEAVETDFAPPEKSSFSIGNFYWLFIIAIWLSSFLARSKSFWAGGVIGLIGGVVGIFIFDPLLLRIGVLFIAPLAGLVLDYVVSKNYKSSISRGGSGGFLNTYGGFRSGSSRGGGSHFGGGGTSSGGGASGSW